MAYRKRDSSGYSSADAYRSLPSTSPSFAHATARSTTTPITASAGAASSSDEDAHLTSPLPAPTPIAQSFVRSRAGSASRSRRRESIAEREERDIGETQPLSPPRPQYLGNDRRSWSASSAGTDPEPASDSDNSAANFAGVGAGAGAPPRPPSVDNSTNGAGVGAGRGPASRTRVATQPVPRQAAPRSRNHNRRRSSMANEYAISAGIAAEDDMASPPVSPVTSSNAHGNPFSTPTDTPRSSFYGAAAPPAVPEKSGVAGKAPPSSYAFPFQSHPGNPDPGLAVPGAARRASLESLRTRALSSPGGPVTSPTSQSVNANLASMATVNATNNNPLTPPGSATGTVYPVPGGGGAGYGLLSDVEELGRPYAPFMGDAGATGSDRSQTPPSPMASARELGMRGYSDAPGLPRTASIPTMSMRAPFLSPASRPTSSLWSPPSFPYAYPPASGSSSALNTYVAASGAGSGAYGGGGLYAGQYPSYADIQAQLRKAKPVMPSSRLPEKLTPEDKPWMAVKDRRARWSYWLTMMGIFAGIAGAAVLCYFSWTGVLLLPDSELCQVFDEDWSNGIDSNWVYDIQLGGFGNGEFQMTTNNESNVYTQNGELYIMPTLTSDIIGTSAIFDGATYKLSDCSVTGNSSACEVTSSAKSYSVINPVMSGRISTRGKKSIKYGRVEVEAKIPTGDWLWPAIWMLPVNNTYGNWPMSGEIDIMEARGNGPSYPAQGSNFVRASLNYGVLPTVQTHLFGWWQEKRSAFSDDFHTYALEWTDSWMRLYVDSRLQAMMNIKIQGKGGKSFFDMGNYPSTAQNGSATEVVVQNIWQEAGAGPNAPYDQEFYLILDVAAGGTSGWFPDNVGGKPWYDGSATAMYEFAKAQSTWAATWPSDPDDRALRVSSVKMWQLGGC